MKLYILEFNESYTGGSVIAIYRNYLEMKLRLSLKYNLILDPYLIELYKLDKLYANDDNHTDNGISLKELTKILKEFPLIKEDILKLANIKNSKDYPESGYSTGNLRIDWILNKCRNYEGLILIDSYEVKSNKTGIISDTYYFA